MKKITIAIIIAAIVIVAGVAIYFVMKESGQKIIVECDGEWTGQLKDDDGIRDISGSGTTEFEVHGGEVSISVNLKTWDTDSSIKVTIKENGKVLEEKTSSMASFTWTYNFDLD